MNGQISFNPGILGDAELIRCFVVRQVELDLILETLRENAAAPESPNQHLLFLGPAGIGKTMLVRRVAAEVRRDEALSRDWHPVVFGEEQDKIGSPGEFWLQALFHLAEQTSQSRWRQAHDELLDEADSQRLRDRALAQLLTFAAERGRRLLLIVENLNTLLGEHFQRGGDWDLRHAFQNEPRLMLLGSATARAGLDQAWQGMFAVRELRPLDDAECIAVWRSVTGSEPAADSVRAVRVLTGGNPRMLSLLARYAATRSFRELMRQLAGVIDSYTPYFKLRLKELPVKERRVFSALLEIWDPAGAREVARRARMGVSAVSALLNRLAGRGEVTIVSQAARRKLYQAEERLFNIYYLMRQSAHPSARVRAVVDFMAHFYSGRALAQMAAALAREALSLSPDQRLEHFLAYEELLGRVPQAGLRDAIIKATPGAFFEAPDLPDSLRALARAPRQPKRLARLLEKALRLMEQGDASGAESALMDATQLEPRQAPPWVFLARLRAAAGRFEEAAEAFGKAVQIEPADGGLRGALVALLDRELGRPEAALSVAEEGIRILRLLVEERGDSALPDLAGSLNNLGVVLGALGRHEEALASAEEAVTMQRRLATERPEAFLPDLAGSLDNLGNVLRALGRQEEGLASAEEAVRILRRLAAQRPETFLPYLAGSLTNLGLAQRAAGRQEALASAEEAVGIYWRLAGQRPEAFLPGLAASLNNLGNRLSELGRWEEALASAEEAADIRRRLADERPEAFLPDLAGSLNNLGVILRALGRREEALASAEEAVSIRRRLAAQRPEVFLPDLAMSLDNLGTLLSALGWREEAVASAEEAVGIYRSLAADRPQAFARQLAISRGNFGLVLVAAGKWEEAILETRLMLEAVPTEATVIGTRISVLIEIAAAGYAREVLEQLVGSPAATALEPLVVGLRIYLGESPVVAQEILEVGKDVAERIRRLRAAREEQPTPSASPPGAPRTR